MVNNGEPSKSSGAVALWLRGFERFEVDKDGGAFKPDKGKPKRVSGLSYVRRLRSERQEERDLIAMELGPAMLPLVRAFWDELLDWVAGGERERREGFVLDTLDRPMGVAELSHYLRYRAEDVAAALAGLMQLGWVELRSCSWAVGGKAVSFGGELAVTKGSALSANDRAARRPLQNETEDRSQGKVNTTETEEGGGGVGEEVAAAPPEKRRPEAQPTLEGVGERDGWPEGKGSGGSPGVGPEDSGFGDADFGQAEVSAAGSEAAFGVSGSGFRAGADAGRGGKAPGLKEPEAATASREKSGSGEGGDWRLRLSCVDVERDEPAFLGQGLSEVDLYAREQMIERAMAWYRELLPSLEPPATARQDIQKQARSDQTTLENWSVKLWDHGGGLARRGAVEVCWAIKRMQGVLYDCKRSRGRLTNPMGMWMTDIKQHLGGEAVRNRGP